MNISFIFFPNNTEMEQINFTNKHKTFFKQNILIKCFHYFGKHLQKACRLNSHQLNKLLQSTLNWLEHLERNNLKTE